MASQHRTRRTVEFADTDMAGIVHFARFFAFMEATEHDFLRSLGLSVALDWEGKQLGFPRLTADCEYLSPARFEDELEIELTVERLGENSISYGFNITRGETIIARGHIKVACCICHPDNSLESVAIPNFIVDKIEGAVGD